MNRAQAVANSARNVAPNPQTALQNLERVTFIHDKRWTLFDPSNTGYVDLDGYKDYAWSAFLAYTPDGSHVVSLEDYMNAFFGPAKILERIRLVDPVRVAHIEQTFSKLDHGRKGYLVQEDLDDLLEGEFRLLDKDQDGRLNHAEFS